MYLFVAFLPEVHIPKGISQNTFPYEIRAILAKILVYENLFNTVVYGAGPMHIIMQILYLNEKPELTEILEITGFC